MRLTAELCQTSLSYLNPLQERELALRGHKIPAIENLGAAGPHECIDFTDNDIRVLENFPLSPQLRTLLCARNRIDTLHPGLERSIPNLSTLVLAQNRLSNLSNLAVLRKLPKLETAVLVDNPVVRQENYRSWVIWLCPKLRFLDYTKIRLREKEMARELFGTQEEPTALATSILGNELDAARPSRIITGDTGKELGHSLEGAERERILEQIRNAKSLSEIQRLQDLLKSGSIRVRPPHGDAMEE